MIVVTGADGIVGRAVCERLRRDGREVVPVVRRRRGITAPDARVADLSEAGSLAALEGVPVEGIVHLAAAVPHAAYYPDDGPSADLTRAIDRNVLRFSRAAGAPVVYMSTCGLYDRSAAVVKHEDDDALIRIESPYFAAKRDGEHLFGREAEAVVLRLAAPVGPGLKARVVLGRFVAAARAGRPIELWGSGTREQNFVDVRDVAELVVRAVERPEPGVVNVAAARATTMTELAQTVVDVVGRGTIAYAGRRDPREGETARYAIDRAFARYAWRPVHSLRDACARIAHEDFDEDA